MMPVIGTGIGIKQDLEIAINGLTLIEGGRLANVKY